MHILVTGGAGFIGSNICKLLLERGHAVRVLDDLSSGYQQNVDALNVEFIRGDIRDAEAVNRAMDGIEGVCHLAASVGNKKSIDDPIGDATANVVGTLNVLEAMRAVGADRISYSSSAGIFGEPQYDPVDEGHPKNPLTPYGSTKLAGENLCFSYMHLYNIRATSLRYFNVYGPHQRYDAYGNVISIFAHLLLESKDLTIFGDGKQTRDFIHVSDIALANVLSLENTDVSGPINLGTGQELSINALATKMTEMSQAGAAVAHGPERPGDVRQCTANVARMKELLGIEASTDFETHLREYMTWMEGDEVLKAA